MTTTSRRIVTSEGEAELVRAEKSKPCDNCDNWIFTGTYQWKVTKGGKTEDVCTLCFGSLKF